MPYSHIPPRLRREKAYAFRASRSHETCRRAQVRLPRRANARHSLSKTSAKNLNKSIVSFLKRRKVWSILLQVLRFFRETEKGRYASGVVSLLGGLAYARHHFSSPRDANGKVFFSAGRI